jgi:hypothetical protein
MPAAIPSLSDYSIAVQNPRIAFSNDRDLRQCQTELNRKQSGPVVATGNFATTFHLMSSQGEWAVRCFYRSLPTDLRKRYEAITDWIARNTYDFLVNAEFVDQGVNVQGKWYPIVKMEWVKGTHLDRYISLNVSRSPALSWVRDAFKLLVDRLEASGMAHGDLSNGNILVDEVNGRLVLVDYDGMYVPALVGMRSLESGHPNYQHPKRETTPNYYDRTIDRFSSIAIFVALSSIAINPRLWSRYSVTRMELDTDNLLFTKDDFADPYSSRLFADLSQIQGVSALAAKLQRVCLEGLMDIPSLQDFISRPFKAPPAQVPIVGEVLDLHRYVSDQGVPYMILIIGPEGGADRMVLVWPPATRLFNDQQYVGRRVRVNATKRNNRFEINEIAQLQLVEGRPEVVPVSDSSPQRRTDAIYTAKFCHIDGKSLRPGASFCLECGTACVKRALPPNANFCYSCGAKLRPGGRFCLQEGVQTVA